MFLVESCVGMILCLGPSICIFDCQSLTRIFSSVKNTLIRHDSYSTYMVSAQIITEVDVRFTNQSRQRSLQQTDQDTIRWNKGVLGSCGNLFFRGHNSTPTVVILKPHDRSSRQRGASCVDWYRASDWHA